MIMQLQMTRSYTKDRHRELERLGYWVDRLRLRMCTKCSKMLVTVYSGFTGGQLNAGKESVGGKSKESEGNRA